MGLKHIVLPTEDILMSHENTFQMLHMQLGVSPFAMIEFLIDYVFNNNAMSQQTDRDEVAQLYLEYLAETLHAELNKMSGTVFDLMTLAVGDLYHCFFQFKPLVLGTLMTERVVSVTNGVLQGADVVLTVETLDIGNALQYGSGFR